MANHEGFFAPGGGPQKGKSLTAFSNSKQSRSDLIALFGRDSLPSSIMRAKRPTIEAEEDAPTANGRKYVDSSPTVKSGEIEKMRTGATMNRASVMVSGRGCQSGALSTFPQNIGRTVLLFYSNPGERVIDPFAGHNSRMSLCVKNGRHYTGCDLSTEFMAFNQQKAKRLRQEYANARIELHHCDSRKLPVPDGVGDFTITSPPYYDIEYYGDEPEQLGKAKTYREFLDGLEQVLCENFRCLRPGAYAVWFVNDFRRKGRFHTYHVDTLKRGERAGFQVHDIMIVDFGPGIRDVFLNQAVAQRLLPKRHEYALVFRKPA